MVPGRWRWRPGYSKGLGVPIGKIAALLGQLGIQVTRWGRPGGTKGRPPGAASLPGLGCGRASQSRGRPRQDRLAGRWGKAWLWAFVGAQLTVYRIAHGRGFTDAAAILGEGYAGVLERDGWAPDRRFEHATNQSCLAHLLRRCRELVSDAVAGQAPPTRCAAS